METDAKDKSAETGSAAFKPLDARVVGEPDEVRSERTTFEHLLEVFRGVLGKSGSSARSVHPATAANLELALSKSEPVLRP